MGGNWIGALDLPKRTNKGKRKSFPLLEIPINKSQIPGKSRNANSQMLGTSAFAFLSFFPLLPPIEM
jgi:hypothetical protein